MGKYIVKRVILAIFTIFIISLITFFAMNAIPGGPFNSEKAKSPAVMKELEARYGLDQPLIVQYKNYMAGVLHGDFGVSLKTDRPISDIIGESFPISAKLGLLAALTAIVFGVVLGSIAALMRNRWPDRVIVFFVTLITSMPSFVIATLLLYFFCIKLGVVQAFSSGSNMILLPVLSLLQRLQCLMHSDRITSVRQRPRVYISTRLYLYMRFVMRSFRSSHMWDL